jgi:uncharacterized protein YkwD
MKTFLILLVLFGLAACGKKDHDSRPEREINPITENKYLELVNRHRKSIGLKALKYDLIIEDVAVDHAEYMATGGAFGHGGWRSRCNRLRAEFDADSCGEIVAMGQTTPEDVLKAWLKSPPHRQSIENPEWTHTGVGLAKNKFGRTYWTQLFLKIK